MTAAPLTDEHLTGAAALVDLDRYPVLMPEEPALAAVIATAREQLRAIGAAELPGFVHAAGVAQLVADAESLEPLAHRSGGLGTVYLGLPDEDLAEGHPRRYLGDYGVGAVAYDQFPTASPLRALYEWEPLRAFIEAILDRGPIHRYADPLGALNLATMADGDQLQWHFDQTDFVVSLAVRSSDLGGDFEVAPLVRTADDEHYDDVGRVLHGDHEAVITLPMRPGTLLVFEGRHSLHRVTPIEGEVTRLVGLLGYDTKAGTESSELLKLVRYGRSA
jgi:hypothetical protein